MPTLDILGKKGQIKLAASNYIFSIMLFPTDESARYLWRKNVFYGQLIKLAAENLNIPNAEPFEKEIIQHIRLHGMEGWATNETWVERTKLIWRNGAYSGVILYHIINMHKLDMRTSLNKALWITAKNWGENLPHNNFIQKIGPLKKCWSEFRSVASLWASAWRCDLKYSEDLSYSLYNKLAELLSVAKWHENEITSIVPRGSKRPIMERKDIWQVPYFPLIEPIKFQVDKQTLNYYQEALADYSAALVVNSYASQPNKKYNK